MLVIVRIAVWQGGHLDQLGAEQAQHVFFLLALRLRNDDERAVAASIGDDGEANPGIARGRFDDEAAGLQFAARFGFEDHLAPGAVLHRAAGVHEFGLAQNGTAGHRRGALELDERRMADGLDDAVADLHFDIPAAEWERLAVSLDPGCAGGTGGISRTGLFGNDLETITLHWRLASDRHSPRVSCLYLTLRAGTGAQPFAPVTVS